MVVVLGLLLAGMIAALVLFALQRELVARRRYQTASLSLPHRLRLEVGYCIRDGYRLRSWDGTSAYLHRDRGVRTLIEPFLGSDMRDRDGSERRRWLRLHLTDAGYVSRELVSDDEVRQELR